MKRNSFYVTMLVLLFISMLIVSQSDAVSADKPGNKIFPKPTITGDYTKIDINNISTYVRNNGSFNRDPGTGDAGFEWPKGSGNTANYASGIWMGAIDSATNTVRVAIAEYAYEYVAGPIGLGINPADDRWRVYKISRGDDALSNPDYANWPGEDGAPYIDVNANGIWDPGTDTPELIGDQTVWCVFNDNDPAVHTNQNTPPLGIEVQLTAFAFARSDALGNTIFYKWKLINKGGRTLKDTYLTVWTDIDLGDSGDDYNGCDTTLGLGYTYNYDAVDGVYGTKVPATGFDFFQGPIVPSPGDTAYVSGLRVPGYKNLKMTSFLKYNNDTSPLGNPQTGQETYNYMRAYDRNGVKVTDPNNNPADFMFPGDPTKAYNATTNWLEQGAGGDRRFLMSSGPFTMVPGDTQEIVAGNLIAVGADFLGSVTALKQADLVAQTAYNLNFKLAAPPKTPTVKAAALDKMLVLNWGENFTLADEIEATHTFDPLADAAGDSEPYYDFEGYVVYQYSNISGSNEKMVATYDIKNNVMVIYDDVFDPDLGAFVNKPVKNGSDNEIQRSLLIKKDYLTNSPLINNKDYYFAVTAYTYNLESVPKTLESSKNIFVVRPQLEPAGSKFNSAYGDTVKGITHPTGVSDGSALAIVVDPSKLTGHTYDVTFTDTEGDITWNLVDKTLNTVLISGQHNQTGDGAYPIAHGMMIKVLGPPPGMKDWDIPSGTRRWTWAGGADGFGLEGFEHAMGMAYHQWFSSSSVTPVDFRNVLIKLAATDVNGNIVPSDTNASFGYRFLRGAAAAPAKPEFAPFILNPTSGYAFQIYEKNTPFAAYNVETDPPTRLMVGFLENNVAGGLVDGKYWPPFYNDADNYAGSGPREWFFIFNVPYSETMDPALAKDILNVTLPIMWWGTPARRAAVAWAAGDEFIILSNHVNSPTDVFSFSTAGIEAKYGNLVLAKQDINRIMAVPNPYFGTNEYERNQFGRVIRFTNLPTQCKFRIFNLQGSLVRTLDKDNPSTTFDWDLLNQNELPVASGMYIVHLDMPGIGTKILKVAVIMAQERLDNF